MTANGWFQIFFYLLVILLVTKPLGIFMARVFSREKTFLDAILRPIEKLIYRLLRPSHARPAWTIFWRRPNQRTRWPSSSANSPRASSWP